MGSITYTILYKIKLKRNLYDNNNDPIWLSGEEIRIFKTEYHKLIEGLRVDRNLFSICDADVDYYFKETLRVEREVLDGK